MISQITRTLNGIYSASNNTIIFPSNPYLLPNNTLTLSFPDTDAKYSTTVSSTSANNAVVTFNNPQYNGAGVGVITNAWNSGITGPQTPWTFNRVVPPTNLFQITYIGPTGGANVNIEVSNDQIGWYLAANVYVANGSSSTTSTEFVPFLYPYQYGRLNIQDINASSGFIVTKSQ